MYKLELSAQVKKDLRKIYVWYEKEQPGLGERFLKHFENSTQQLIETPLNFPVVFRNKRRQVLNVNSLLLFMANDILKTGRIVAADNAVQHLSSFLMFGAVIALWNIKEGLLTT